MRSVSALDAALLLAGLALWAARTRALWKGGDRQGAAAFGVVGLGLAFLLVRFWNLGEPRRGLLLAAPGALAIGASCPTTGEAKAIRLTEAKSGNLRSIRASSPGGSRLM